MIIFLFNVFDNPFMRLSRKMSVRDFLVKVYDETMWCLVDERECIDV